MSSRALAVAAAVVVAVVAVAAVAARRARGRFRGRWGTGRWPTPWSGQYWFRGMPYGAED